MKSKSEGIVNYLRFVDLPSKQQSRMKSYRTGPNSGKRKPIGPTYRPIYYKKNPQRWQIALALMPPLKVHDAIAW